MLRSGSTLDSFDTSAAMENATIDVSWDWRASVSASSAVILAGPLSSTKSTSQTLPFVAT